MDDMQSFFERRPLLRHLDELLVRSRRIILYLFAGAILGYIFSERVMELLQAPLVERMSKGAKLIFTTPFEKLWVYLRIGVVNGFIIVLPFIGREIAAFVAPGLKAAERQRIFWILISSALAFVVGAALGYRFVLPALLDAVLKFGSGRELPFLTVSSYTNTVLGVLLLCALLMELPVVMVHLSTWGWVRAETWARGRRMALVANALVSAILSPPDAISMILMMIPVQLLYEGGIFLSRVAQWYFHERAGEQQIQV
jgi:sec-independent protein translocase protein TatC